MAQHMTLDEVRQECREGFDPDIVLGMMLALGTDYRALCFRCRGCESPVCWFPGLHWETMFQFRG